MRRHEPIVADLAIRYPERRRVKRDVYDPAQRAYRIAFAARVILTCGQRTRAFEACFEMGDGEEVLAGLMRRARKNPDLAERLPLYVNPASLKPDRYNVKVYIGPTRVFAMQAKTAPEGMDWAADYLQCRPALWQQARIVVERTNVWLEGAMCLMDTNDPPDAEPPRFEL